VIVLDARQGNLDLSRLPEHARVIFLLPPAPATEHAALLSKRNVTSLIAADETTDEAPLARITKALRGEVVGLSKHQPWRVTVCPMTISNREEKKQALALLLEYAAVAGCRGSVRERLSLAADEMMGNAVKHGNAGACQVPYGCSGRWFGLAVR